MVNEIFLLQKSGKNPPTSARIDAVVAQPMPLIVKIVVFKPSTICFIAATNYRKSFFGKVASYFT